MPCQRIGSKSTDRLATDNKTDAGGRKSGYNDLASDFIFTEETGFLHLTDHFIMNRETRFLISYHVQLISHRHL